MTRGPTIYRLAILWALIGWVGVARPLSRSASDPPAQVPQHGAARFMPQRALYQVRAIPAPARAEIDLPEPALMPGPPALLDATMPREVVRFAPSRPRSPALPWMTPLLC